MRLPCINELRAVAIYCAQHLGSCTDSGVKRPYLSLPTLEPPSFFFFILKAGTFVVLGLNNGFVLSLLKLVSFKDYSSFVSYIGINEFWITLGLDY